MLNLHKIQKLLKTDVGLAISKGSFNNSSLCGIYSNKIKLFLSASSKWRSVPVEIKNIESLEKDREEKIESSPKESNSSIEDSIHSNFPSEEIIEYNTNILYDFFILSREFNEENISILFEIFKKFINGIGESTSFFLMPLKISYSIGHYKIEEVNDCKKFYVDYEQFCNLLDELTRFSNPSIVECNPFKDENLENANENNEALSFSVQGFLGKLGEQENICGFLFLLLGINDYSFARYEQDFHVNILNTTILFMDKSTRDRNNEGKSFFIDGSIIEIVVQKLKYPPICVRKNSFNSAFNPGKKMYVETEVGDVKFGDVNFICTNYSGLKTYYNKAIKKRVSEIAAQLGEEEKPKLEEEKPVVGEEERKREEEAKTELKKRISTRFLSVQIAKVKGFDSFLFGPHRWNDKEKALLLMLLLLTPSPTQEYAGNSVQNLLNGITKREDINQEVPKRVQEEIIEAANKYRASSNEKTLESFIKDKWSLACEGFFSRTEKLAQDVQNFLAKKKTS